MSIFRRTVLFPILLLVLAVSLPQPGYSKGKIPPDAEEEDYDDDNPPSQELKKTEETVQKEEAVAKESQESKTKAPQVSTETPKQEVQSVQPLENEPEPQKEAEVPLKQYPPETVAQETPPLPAGSQIHTVWIWQESRDCLWQLAKEHYGDPWQWKKIYLANRNTIPDPNVIFPKQKIIIPSLAHNSK